MVEAEMGGAACSAADLEGMRRLKGLGRRLGGHDQIDECTVCVVDCLGCDMETGVGCEALEDDDYKPTKSEMECIFEDCMELDAATSDAMIDEMAASGDIAGDDDDDDSTSSAGVLLAAAFLA